MPLYRHTMAGVFVAIRAPGVNAPPRDMTTNPAGLCPPGVVPAVRVLPRQMEAEMPRPPQFTREDARREALETIKRLRESISAGWPSINTPPRRVKAVRPSPRKAGRPR